VVERVKLNIDPDAPIEPMRDGQPPVSRRRVRYVASEYYKEEPVPVPHYNLAQVVKYHDGIPEYVYRMRLLGLTVAQIVAVLDICERTYTNWLKDKPALKEAHDRGGKLADGQVAQALFWRATGYSYKSEKLFYDAKTATVIRAEYVEHLPPDTQAINMWLTNRAKDNWRNRIEHADDEDRRAQPPVLVINPVAVKVDINHEPKREPALIEQE